MELIDYFIKEARLFFVTDVLGANNPTKTKQIKEYEYCLDLLLNKGTDPGKDYTKGVLAMSSGYGQGKTFFFEVLAHMYFRNKGKNLFTKTSAKDLASIYQKGGEDALLFAIKSKHLFIDDLGDEDKEGNKIFAYHKDGYKQSQLNVMRFVLFKRYEMWEQKGFKTSITTNLSIEAIAKFYDGRLADRLYQMCDVRDFTFIEKGSFRQVKEVRKLTKEEIAINWKKLYPDKKDVGIDKLEYLKDLASRSDVDLEDANRTIWRVVKNYLIELEIITESDLVINDVLKGRAFAAAKLDTISLVNLQYKNAPDNIKTQQRKLAIERIKPDYVYELAKWLKAKELFLKLRKEGKFGADKSNSN